MTPLEIAEAWNSVTDEFFVRCYKGKEKPWQVCHLSGNVISDATLKVISSHGSQSMAERHRERRENEARGKAVLRAMRNERRRKAR